MKSKTIYVAEDGTRFETAKEATTADRLIVRLQKATKPLGKKPSDPHCDFSNGGGYIQHDMKVVLLCRIAVVKILREGPLKWYMAERTEKEGLKDSDWHPSGILSRVIDDSDLPDRVKNIWYRFSCIDVKGREWGQPYFALHPEKGVQKKILR